MYKLLELLSHVAYPLNNMILVVDQFRKYIRTIIKVERRYVLNDEKNEACTVEMKLMFIVRYAWIGWRWIAYIVGKGRRRTGIEERQKFMVARMLRLADT
jgi:hypothetical protein